MQDYELKPIHAAAGGAVLIALVLAITALTGPTVAAPDFREFEAGPERKAAFFEYMQPIVEARNAGGIRQKPMNGRSFGVGVFVDSPSQIITRAGRE